MNLNLKPAYRFRGIYSQFMLSIPYAATQEDVIDKIYFMSPAEEGFNYFDWVFDQSLDDSFVGVDCYNPGTWGSNKTVGNGCIENSHLFRGMKDAVRRIKIKDHIQKKVDDFCAKNLTARTLGVHVRTADMNIYHPHFGVFYTKDYIAKIREILDTEYVENIFVASDNKASIDEIRGKFGAVVSYDCELREKDENFRNDNMHVEHFTEYKLWEEAFVEMLILSRCYYFLCRVSNLANAAILFSDDLKKIYRL